MQKNSHSLESLRSEKLKLEIQLLQRPFYQKISFWLSLLSVMIVLMSGMLTEYINGYIKRSDLKLNQFESVSASLSNYLVVSETYVQLIKQNVVDRDVIADMEPRYNTALLAVRTTGPFAYAVIRNFWNAKLADQYAEILQEVAAFDSTIHDLNPFFLAVETGKTDNIVYKQVKPIVDKQETQLKKLQVDIQNFLLAFAYSNA